MTAPTIAEQIAVMRVVIAEVAAVAKGPRSLARLRAVLATLESVPAMLAALRAADRYFTACARAWAANEGRVVNSAGDPIVEAEGLDELANIAGELTEQALAAVPPAPEETT